MFFVLGLDLRSIYLIPTIVIYTKRSSFEIRWLILAFAFGFHSNGKN